MIKSLGKKTTVVILFVSFLLASVAIFASFKVYSNTMDAHYRELASNVAKTAVTQMDAEKIATYLQTMQKDQDYENMLSILYDIKDSNDVKFLYVLKIDGDKVYYIMDADKDEATVCELGEQFDTAQAVLPYVNDLANGIPAFITKSEFGWLCTSHEPIINSKGEVVAMVGVDISMNEVMSDRQEYLISIIVILSALTGIITVLFLIFIRQSVIKPINQLAKAASEFVSDKKLDGISSIAKLNIHTKDEIENLAKAIKVMERDINEYIDNLTKVTAERERLEAELSVATQIQISMMPCIFPAFPERSEFDIYAIMEPAKEVGGDFYDFFLVDNNHLCIVIADVSGKGVPAALFMVITKNLIKNRIQTGESPQDAFTTVNRQLCENNEAGMFVTAWMGILEIDTGAFTFVNAGHNPPLIRRVGGSFEWIKTKPDFVLAGIENVQYTKNEIRINPGDILYLYTDGVTEALNTKQEFFGEDRLLKILNMIGMDEIEPVELLHIVKGEIDKFSRGVEQADDITMVGLKINVQGDKYAAFNSYF